MKRGEIWTVAGGADYSGKPRPVVILQDDRFDKTNSVTVCALTTDPTEAPLFRLLIKPSESNGLRAECRLMVDKVTTVPKTKLGTRVGQLADKDMLRLNRVLLVFLGIAAPLGEWRSESPPTNCRDKRLGLNKPAHFRGNAHPFFRAVDISCGYM